MMVQPIRVYKVAVAVVWAAAAAAVWAAGLPGIRMPMMDL